MNYCDVFTDKSIEFYKNNIIAFCEVFFGVELEDEQKAILAGIQFNKYIKDFYLGVKDLHLFYV